MKRKTNKKSKAKKSKPLDLYSFYNVMYIDNTTGDLVYLENKTHSELINILDMVHPDDYIIFHGKRLTLEEIRPYEGSKQTNPSEIIMHLKDSAITVKQELMTK